jgi:hypothetical protein
LPHSLAIDPGKLYVADRANKRIQIFSADADFLGMWTGMGAQNEITHGQDGNFYIAEQEGGDKPAYLCVRMDKERCSPAWRAAPVHRVGAT